MPDKVYENESQFVADALLEFGSLPWLWVWRENTGVAYGMGRVKQMMKMVMVGHIREAIQLFKSLQPTTYGIPGRADISGILQGGRFFAIEAKWNGGKRSKEQVTWAENFVKMGGFYVLAEQLKDVWLELERQGYPRS